MDAASEAYLKALQIEPDKKVAVIIATAGNSADYVEQVTEAGITVTRTFSLISALAAHGPACAVLALKDKPWIVSIEPDSPVKTA